MAAKDVFTLLVAVFGVLLFISAVMVCLPLNLIDASNVEQIGVAYLAGARFDIAIEQIKVQGAEVWQKLANPNPDPPAVSAAKAVTSSIAEAAASIKKEL